MKTLRAVQTHIYLTTTQLHSLVNYNIKSMVDICMKYFLLDDNLLEAATGNNSFLSWHITFCNVDSISIHSLRGSKSARLKSYEL